MKMSINLGNCILSQRDLSMKYGNNPVNQTGQVSDVGVIRYFPILAPPFITLHYDFVGMNDIPIDLVCGPLIRILEQMSIKFGYR